MKIVIAQKETDEGSSRECDLKETEREEKVSEESSNIKVEINLQDNVRNLVEKEEAGEEEQEEENSDSYFSESCSNTESDYETADSEVDQNRVEDLSTKFTKLNCKPTEFVVQDENNTKHNADDILIPVTKSSDDENVSDEYVQDESDDDNDDNGWITPGKSCYYFLYKITAHSKQ